MKRYFLIKNFETGRPVLYKINQDNYRRIFVSSAILEKLTPLFFNAGRLHDRKKFLTDTVNLFGTKTSVIFMIFPMNPSLISPEAIE